MQLIQPQKLPELQTMVMDPKFKAIVVSDTACRFIEAYKIRWYALQMIPNLARRH